MRAVATVCFAVLLSVGLAAAQEFSKLDIFGGYTYVNVDTNDLSSSRQSMNGWNTSISASANRFFAVEADVSGYYKNNLESTGVDVRDYAFAAGPRVNLREFFVHALFGVDHLVGSYSSVSVSQNSFASLFGGGVQINVARHWAVRTTLDYVLTHHNIFKIIDPSAPNYTQNNFRVGGGVVYVFGSGKRDAALTNENGRTSTIARSGARSQDIPALGISVSSDSDGLRIISIVANSPAERALLSVGDTVLMVNGKSVATPEDLVAAVGEKGEVKLTIQHKYWTTEKMVKLD
jgi:opacity protein-like surface antigen